MSFKTLVCHVRADASSEALVPTAVALARAQDAHLIGIGALSSPYLANPSIAYLDAPTVDMTLTQDRAALDAAEMSFARTAGLALGVKAHWRAVEDMPNAALLDAAAEADLVLATLERGPADSFVDVPALVCEIGLPILAVPPNWSEVLGRSILIAWRNTREAHRAVSMALPMLRGAAQVRLVEVAPNAQDALNALSVHAVAARLERHGVRTSAEVRVTAGDAAQDLLAAADTAAADLLVLGAYGHSRAQEWVLGGVTRSLIAAARLPLFLVH